MDEGEAGIVSRHAVTAVFRGRCESQVCESEACKSQQMKRDRHSGWRNHRTIAHQPGLELPVRYRFFRFLVQAQSQAANHANIHRAPAGIDVDGQQHRSLLASFPRFFGIFGLFLVNQLWVASQLETRRTWLRAGPVEPRAIFVADAATAMIADAGRSAGTS